MAAIRFPGSVGTGSGQRRTENSHTEARVIRRVFRPERGGDLVQISAEAKNRFERENLVKLEKIRMMKEAEALTEKLAGRVNFKESDLRNVYRLDKITTARSRMLSGYYSENEDHILKNILKNTL